MKTNAIVILLAFFALAACKDEGKKKIDDLQDKVMAVHDEVMPKMGDLMKYKKQLKAKIDTLTSQGLEENEAKIAQMEEAIMDLDNSHEQMMGWMREYNPDFEGMVKEEVMEYLDDQMGKIENVGTMTNSAIKEAQKLLAE